MKNLEFFGMLCLGAFVAGILNYGLSLIKNTDTFKKVTSTIFAAAFSGVVFLFLEFLIKRDGKLEPASAAYRSIYMYPVGLILSLLWLQIGKTITRIESEKRSHRIIGWLHFSVLSIATVGLPIWILFGKQL